MEGIHSVDNSLIVAPVVHDFIASTLDMLKIDYKQVSRQRSRTLLDINKMLI